MRQWEEKNRSRQKEKGPQRDNSQSEEETRASKENVGTVQLNKGGGIKSKKEEGAKIISINS